jgi:hypothetical protein
MTAIRLHAIATGGWTFRSACAVRPAAHFTNTAFGIIAWIPFVPSIACRALRTSFLWRPSEALDATTYEWVFMLARRPLWTCFLATASSRWPSGTVDEQPLDPRGSCVKNPAHQRAFFFGMTGFRHARQTRAASCLVSTQLAGDEQ